MSIGCMVKILIGFENFILYNFDDISQQSPL
jgi:hypothetical protein